MSAEADQLAGELELTIDESGLPDFELPEWYVDVTDRVSVMTPYATSIVHGKAYGSIAPFSRDFAMVGRHYAWPDRMTYREVRHENLHPNKIRFKVWGGREEVHRVVVNDQREVSDK